MTRYLLISSLVFTLACGDDDDNNSADAGATADAAVTVDAAIEDDAAIPLTIDDVCDPDTGVFVDFFNAAIDCFPQFEIFLGQTPSNQDFSDACFGQFGAFVTDGTITLGTQGELAACAAAIDAIDCATFDFDTTNACVDVFKGTLAVADDCDSDEQCIGDSFCDDSAVATCGACLQRKADGAACTDNEECIGRRCSDANICRGFGLIGDACVSVDDCAGQLQCNELTSVCEAATVWAAGDACTTFETDCGFPISNLFCDVGNTLTCIEYLPVGGACTNSFQCNFIGYERCDIGGTDLCVAPTIRALGESCQFINGEKCGPGLSCSDPSDGGVCQAQAVVGDACTQDGNECGDFLLECVNDQCQYGDYSGMCPAAT